MSRLSIMDLCSPADRLDPAKAAPCQETGQRFETISEARAEDRLRAQLIRSAYAKGADLFNTADALALADRLEESGRGGQEPHSLASSVFMRRRRRCIVAGLWELVSDKVSTFTLRCDAWVLSAAALLKFDPTRMLNELRSALMRAGANGSKGYIFLAIHGEFDPVKNLFELHIHGVASDEMIAVVDRLRSTRRFATAGPTGDKTRVRVSRGPLTNLPYPLSYIVQSWWPNRWRAIVNGRPKRSRIRGRIPEPYHTAMLLWLDRWSLKETTLLIGLEVRKGGLVPTRSKTYVNVKR